MTALNAVMATPITFNNTNFMGSTIDAQKGVVLELTDKAIQSLQGMSDGSGQTQAGSGAGVLNANISETLKLMLLMLATG